MFEREQIRQLFFDTWRKYNNREPLSALEQQLIKVINSHREYHSILENLQQDQDYSSDNNPFLHMGLHLSLQEQLNTNRPTGIHDIYQRLANKLNDAHRAEHLMMDVMANILWDAQQNKNLPDEKIYLAKLQQLVK